MALDCFWRGILYLGTRMRANQLGVEPQQLTQQAMLAASYGLLAGTVIQPSAPRSNLRDANAGECAREFWCRNRVENSA